MGDVRSLQRRGLHVSAHLSFCIRCARLYLGMSGAKLTELEPDTEPLEPWGTRANCMGCFCAALLRITLFRKVGGAEDLERTECSIT